MQKRTHETRDEKNWTQKDYVVHSLQKIRKSKLTPPTWSIESLEYQMFNDCEGWCSACGEISAPHEPDAVNNWCPCCDSSGTVISSLVLEGLI